VVGIEYIKRTLITGSAITYICYLMRLADAATQDRYAMTTRRRAKVGDHELPVGDQTDQAEGAQLDTS